MLTPTTPGTRRDNSETIRSPRKVLPEPSIPDTATSRAGRPGRAARWPRIAVTASEALAIVSSGPSGNACPARRRLLALRDARLPGDQRRDLRVVAVRLAHQLPNQGL